MANELLATHAPRSTPRGGGAESRVHVRYTCDLPSACRPTSEPGVKESRWSATLSDISPGGLRLVLGRRFEPGTNLTIELPGVSGQEGYSVIARVVHVRVCPDNLWAHGCRFLGELTEGELIQLIPTINPPDPAPDDLATIDAAPPFAPSRAKQLVLHDVKLQLETEEGELRRFLLRRVTLPRGRRPVPGKTLTFNIADPGAPPRMFRAQVIRWDWGAKGEVVYCRCL